MKMNVACLMVWGMFCSYAASQMQNKMNKSPEEIANQHAVVRRVYEPHETWKAFVRHAERTNDKHRNRQRAKNAKGLRQLKGLRGPRGPPGPPGPAGKELLMADIKQLVKEATESLVQGLLSDNDCANCNDTKLPRNLAPLFDIDEVSIVPKLVWGFHCQMSANKQVGKRDFQELVGFHTPFASGSFQRGDGIGAEKGRFVVPSDAVYHLVANIHLRQKREKVKTNAEAVATAREMENLRVLICINTLCKDNMSLESTVMFGRGPWKMTSHVAGHLLLKKGDFVSVLIDNKSSQAVIVQRGSYFGGVMVGF